jgi:diadenylate cyclase
MFQAGKIFLTHWRDAIEIIILAICLYQIFRAFKATQGARILVGLLSILIVLTLISELFNFVVIGWIITRAAAALALALIVIFQPELRNALAKLGSSRLFLFSDSRKLVFIENFADTVISLSKKRIGALFAIERNISMKSIVQTGVTIDAKFSQELTTTIFHPKAPLHDGGMIIANDRIAAAACVFPVSQKEIRDRSTGLRHRAGIGISEETDGVIVVVSEETGSISICIDGELTRCISPEDFRERIDALFSQNPSTLNPHEETSNA